MKKTLFLLAATAFALSASPAMANEVTVNPYGSIQSPMMGNTIGLSATLINSSTGGQIWYDLRTNPIVYPPFDIGKGHIHWALNLADSDNTPGLDLDSLVLTEEDTLTLDFTVNMNNLSGPVDAEYVVVMFRRNTGYGDYFSTWYEENGANITGRFNNGDYTAYVISETCDMEQDASTYGGLVFFNNSVAPTVLAAETFPGEPEPEPEPSTPTIPEPTTATLSLLALAGLAARRRRK